MLSRINREPVALFRYGIQIAMSGIVDEEVVIVLQGRSELGQGADDFRATRIEECLHLEAIHILQQKCQVLCVLHPILEPGQVCVFIVTDDQCMVGTKMD